MNAEARRAFSVHFRNAQEHIRELKLILPNLQEDLAALSRAMKDEPLLIGGSFNYVVNRLDEISQYAHEIDAAVRRKREDGEAADRRIDAMVGTVQ